MALTLVISKLSLRFCHKLWIILGSVKTRAAQANSMALAEGPICTCPINLISTDDFWMVAILVAIGLCLRFQIFSFVVGGMAELIQEGKAIACHRH